ncbi:PTS glucose transporter subunit IIABC [Spiroplasma cantharicola]|uniref:PTS system, beta-glucoside-specific IIABC component n=1 Tax=Spiroplasma cantharicola TaxID=362837 RepID=A0A0M4KD08_9MOLU|nr:PTS glucose transporter subunit IIABC [Spiroplasma cantharicola]ALD66715.1 PTS system, beta-glucoside-specific IIABC component [Spiroplasma cantharicola]
MSIKLYAPVDCEVKRVEKCSDEAFANKMLGDGILIIPKNNIFFSPFFNAKVKMIFNTKHAYKFEVEGFNVLLHCGLESVNLNGKYFETDLKINQEVDLKTKLFSVEIIELEKLNILTETPIVFEDPKIKIPYFEERIYKKGELICEINLEDEKKLDNESIDPYTFFETDSKYIAVGRKINEFIGGKENYTNFYNCATRLRFKIKNKDKVDLKKIKEQEIVKSVIWSSDELQIIIGPDVYKLKNAIGEINDSGDVSFALKEKVKSNKPKVSLFFGTIMAIILRILPFLVGLSLLQAAIAMFQQLGWMPDITTDPTKETGDTIYLLNAPVIWAMIFIMARTSIVMLGIMIAWSTSDYFKLRPVIGIGIGAILCSPYLFVSGGPNGMGEHIVIFELWDQPLDPKNPVTLFLKQLSEVRLNGMNTKPLVILPTILLAKKMDDKIGEWMPPSLELIGRPFLIFITTLPIAFLIFSPIWNVIEALMAIFVFYFKNIPFGLGIGFYVAFWQIAIIFGIHSILAMVQFLDHIINGGQTEIGVAGGISLFAQFGALVAVIIVTKNIKLRNQSIGLITAAVIGVTEPILYQVNLPKRRPLYSGIIGAFVFGTLSGLLGITTRAKTGWGFLELIGYYSDPILGGTSDISPLANGLMYTFCCLGSFLLSGVICVFWFKERKSEKKLVKEVTNNLVKLVKLQDGQSSLEFKTEVYKINKMLNSMNEKMIKEYEIKIQNLVLVRTKIQMLNSKLEKAKERILLKGKKLMNENKIEKANKLISKYKILIEKYDVSDFEKKLLLIEKEIDFKTLDLLISNNLNEVSEVLNKYKQKIGENKIEQVKNNYNNALNALRINYELDVQNDNILNFEKEFKMLRG